MAESKVKLVLSFLNKNMSEGRWYTGVDIASRAMEVKTSYAYIYAIMVALSKTSSMNKNNQNDRITFARIKRLTHKAYLKGAPKYEVKKKPEIEINQELCDKINVLNQGSISDNMICKATGVKLNTLLRIKACNYVVDDYINYVEPSIGPCREDIGKPDLSEGPKSDTGYLKAIMHNINWLCKSQIKIVEELDEIISHIMILRNPQGD